MSDARVGFWIGLAGFLVLVASFTTVSWVLN